MMRGVSPLLGITIIGYGRDYVRGQEDVGILLRHIEEVNLVDARSPAIYCVGWHSDPEVIGEGIDGGRPNAAARRATCHHKRIDSEVNQVTHQRCSEERTRMSFRQHNILRARPDPVNELVAL